ncbi:putative homeodomain-like protein [Vibrio phage 249E41-1]|nr:putative homeodomain-like protein [Vibrio phage 249E41-1]
MALKKYTIQQIIDLKHEDLLNRQNPKFKGNMLSNRDIAEIVLGSRSAESTVRRVWKKYLKQGHYKGVVGTNPIAGGSVSNPISKRKQATGKRFVITSAQNNTHIHEDFFQSILQYCEHNDAELMVSPFFYNKNGFQNGKREEAWFDERVKPFLVNESVQLAKGLVFNGELNILPTARNPLSGFDTYNGDQSGIVPHVKMELQSLPSPKFDDPRSLFTTGTLTKRNYIQQKAGQLAEWDHVFGAVVVEVDDEGDWFVRQLHAESKTGCFYDLDKYYTPKGVVTNEVSVEAIQFGDIHRDKLRDSIADLCWNKEGSLTHELTPNYLFLHDVHDHARRNHHNIKDPYFLFKQFHQNKECVREEVGNTVSLLEDMTNHRAEVVVVESNHDLALERWLKEQDYRRDPVNAEFFLEMQLANYRTMKQGKELQTFKTACEIIRGKPFENVTFLKTDEPFRLHDIEMGQHGHNGNNGARGSAQAFRKQGIKFNIGHSHAPLIKGGVYQAGACMLVEDAGYAKGGSSWSVSHIVTYSNGKRTIITCKNGKWKA